jgi:hypothetical protein
VTVIARRIASVPVRTAVETWTRIVDLVTAPGSEARTELAIVTSTAAMLIADEQTRDAPITIASAGPLVRVYTVHADDAIEHDDADEADLPFDPTSGDAWTLSLPASGPDVEIAGAAVADCPHVEVRDVGEGAEDATSAARASRGEVTFDLDEIER